ncbi:MAG: GH92 family glycosyl hydrolase [Muribaculaceae bacterium]
MKVLCYTAALWLAFTALFSSCTANDAAAPEESLTQYVNPLIGTAHCRWFHFAPGALPFGMAKPGAATNASAGNKSGWEATGYDYRDTTIEGFPCLHEFQVGGIVLMPTSGELITVPGAVGSTDEGYRSVFSHDEEVAQPGYYSVMLKRYGIKAEVTATKRVAYQRFTFAKGDDNHVLFDIGNRQGESGPAMDAEVHVDAQGLVEGWVETLPTYCDKYQKGATVKLYFSAQTDVKPSAIGTFVKEKTMPGDTVVRGAGAGAYLTFATQADGETVTAQVGLSYTSVENARNNRLVETNHGALTFDEAAAQSHETWEEYLSRIRVETDSREDKVKFYTGLYHAIKGRGLASDVNGDYPKNDGTVGHIPTVDGKPQFSFYNTDGIWGGQWNLVQVWALAYPEYLSDYVSTHVQVFKDAGWMGDGIANSRYVSGVGTNQLGIVVAAAYLCGIRDFDVEAAYAAARRNELDGTNRPMGAGKLDTDKFLKYGYVPHLDQGPWPDESWMFSASHTLEYSFGAYAVAQMAKSLGKEADYERLMELSTGWEKLYDPELNLIHPRWENGKFVEDFDPMQVWRGFQEGNAYQYTFYVPHNPKGLIAKMGAEEFSARLDSIFTWSEPKLFSGGTTIDAFAGLQTYYNQGNQPCLHISWLFNEAGRPSLTQKWVRRILDEFYGADGIHGYGYGQDEDQGQLGAWYVISSLGMFDVGGLANYEPSLSLGSTKFNKVTIKLNPKYYKGEQFVIEAKGNSAETPYVQRYVLNGEQLNSLRVPFSTITRGGKLQVEMGANPVDDYSAQ